MENTSNVLYENSAFVNFYGIIRNQNVDHGVFSRHLTPSQDVLDVGCGEGTLTLALKDSVRSITAFDKSKEMLLRAKAKASQIHAPNVTFIEDDMHIFDFSRQFHSAIMGNSVILEVVETARQVALLRRINKHLVIGGGLLLTTILFSAEMIKDEFHAREITDPDTGERFTISYRNNLDFDNGIWDTVILFVNLKTGEENRFPLRLSLMTRREMYLILQLAGFEIENEIKDKSTGQRSFFSCRKQHNCHADSYLSFNRDRD